MRALQMTAVAWIAGTVAAGCADTAPTLVEDAAAAQNSRGAPASAASLQLDPPPISIEPLTARHEFTDEVAAQIRLKAEGRSRDVVNLQDASRMAVLRITVQPGARFPWHTHPGPVLVAVTQGQLNYVYADDCLDRPYGSGTAFVDPGSNVHYAFNPTAGETVVVATFLGAPAAGPLTIPVDAATSTALDAKCEVAAATQHAH